MQAQLTAHVSETTHINVGTDHVELGRASVFVCCIWCRDEDHLALFIELLGRIPRRLSGTGKYAKDYFNRHGELRHIKKMRFWPLDKVLSEKYHLPEDEVRS